MPGLDAFDVRRPPRPGTDYDTAVVIDSTRQRWVVRAPQHAAAGAALEAEVVLLGLLGPNDAASRLPFAVPVPVGFAHLPEGGRATVHPEIPGQPLDLEHLQPGPGLAASLGRALAALHELPTSIVENANRRNRSRRMPRVSISSSTSLLSTVPMEEDLRRAFKAATAGFKS